MVALTTSMVPHFGAGISRSRRMASCVAHSLRMASASRRQARAPSRKSTPTLVIEGRGPRPGHRGGGAANVFPGAVFTVLVERVVRGRGLSKCNRRPRAATGRGCPAAASRAPGAGSISRPRRYTHSTARADHRQHLGIVQAVEAPGLADRRQRRSLTVDGLGGRTA